MLPLLFILSSRKKTSAGACQHLSAVTGGPIAALLPPQFGALLGSHFRLRSIHPSQHGIWPSYPRDFSVEYPAGYSLRRRFSNYPDLFWSDKKVSTAAGKCQPPDSGVCLISGRCLCFYRRTVPVYSLHLKSSYPNFRIAWQSPFSRSSTISGSFIPLKVLFFTIV